MRRNLLIILGFLVLAGVVLAVVLSSKGSGSGATSTTASAGPSPPCLPSTLEHSARLPHTNVDASPAPGSAVASPHTQISFLGTSPSQIASVTVVGSRSGAHSGRLADYSQGDGASFEPSVPFDEGEQVSVHAVIGSGSSAEPVHYSFQVDTPYPTAHVAGFQNPQAAPGDYQSFATLPGAQVPVMDVTVPDRDPAAGLILTSNGPGPGQYGPLIYRPDGSLVWFDRLAGGETAENLNEQTYEGKPVLTWWHGRVLEFGFGQGEDEVMDSSYRTIARVRAGNGLHADLHDFRLLPGGVAYITAFNPIRCDLTPSRAHRTGPSPTLPSRRST